MPDYLRDIAWNNNPLLTQYRWVYGSASMGIGDISLVVSRMKVLIVCIHSCTSFHIPILLILHRLSELLSILLVLPAMVRLGNNCTSCQELHFSAKQTVFENKHFVLSNLLVWIKDAQLFNFF